MVRSKNATHERGLRRRLRPAFYSAVIIGVLSLQSYTTLRICTRAPLYVPFIESHHLSSSCAPKLWPFLTYPMYSRAKFDGDTLTDYRVYVLSQDSSSVYISPDELGIGFWRYRSDFVSAIRDNDQEKLGAYVDLISRLRDERPWAFRLNEVRWRLSRQGFIEEGEFTVKDLRLSNTTSS